MSKVSECKFKMKRLFDRENGCISETERGSFIVGQCDNWLEAGDLMYVSFGWNIRDVIFGNKKEITEVVLLLSENGYEAYHSEDIIMYVNQTNDVNFLQCRANLPGGVINKEDFMKLKKNNSLNFKGLLNRYWW